MSNNTNDRHAHNATGMVCYSPLMITTSGVWEGTNPLEYSLPIFILQLTIVVITTRALVLILRPFRQPIVLAEIIGGIVLGPSVLGKIEKFGSTIFPPKSMLSLETTANVGLLYFLFLVGVEMDVMVIKRTGHKALVIALAGMIVPFAIGTSTSFLFRHTIASNIEQAPFLIFLGVALSITAFPVLARILTETKLITSELGRTAMSASIVNDVCAWLLLALTIALVGAHHTALASLYVLLSGLAFVLFCFYAVRPIMWRIVRRIPEGEAIGDFCVGAILASVMVAGFITDAIGIHSAFGAFVFGLVIPNGPLGVTLIEKLEGLVTGLLVPAFFVISGLRTNIWIISEPEIAGLLVLVFILASIGKIVGTMLIALFYSMSISEGLALGFLMNARGVIEMIILNIGKDKQVLDDQSFSIMVVMSAVMTSLITPVVTSIRRPVRRLAAYKRRNLQRAKPDSELRMLACIHGPRHVPSVLSLLDASNPTKRSPIFMYALNLVELSGRSSAMLIVHNTSSSSSSRLGPAPSDQIISAFSSYEQHAAGVSVQTLTAVSPYSTMHDDICSLAEDKHASLVVLPFHKQQAVDGTLELTNPAISTVNRNVLATATCSVAILVDRGLSSTTSRHHYAAHNIALLFFGGPDDREALAYAWRMAEHPDNTLKVVRFMPASRKTSPSTDPRAIRIVTDDDQEWQQDDDYVNEFRLRTVNDETVTYIERMVATSEDTVAAIRSMGSAHDVFIVGRGVGEAAPGMVAGMTEWMECPELGPVGDFLASADFAATVSVLVVQQYVGPVLGGGETTEQPMRHYETNGNNKGRMVAGGGR